jgi:hypothetical protein
MGCTSCALHSCRQYFDPTKPFASQGGAVLPGTTFTQVRPPTRPPTMAPLGCFRPPPPLIFSVWPKIGVATLDRNGWLPWIGISGHLGSESVATLDRNQWPLWIGISGHLASESVATLVRNPHRYLWRRYVK